MGSDVEMGSSSDPDDLYEEIEKMKALLLEDSRSYKNNNEMLQLLHRNGDFEELIEARDKIVQKVPLTSANWLIWIAEKRENGGTYEEIENVFEKALKDSNDVAIWLERIYFAFSYGVAKTRETFEKALASHGTRYDSGGQIWLAFLSFETANAQGNPTEENMQFLEQLYKRALRVATKHLEEIYEEACQICGENSNGEIKAIFEETMKLARKLEKFEEDLTGPEGYQKYMQFEIEYGEPARIHMMHERIVGEFCEDENAWSAYGIWCEKQLQIHTICAKIYQRALRFCPYSCILHQEALLAFERAQKAHEEIDGIFEFAKENVIYSAENGRALYKTYIYLRRRRVSSSGKTEDFAKIAEIFEEGAARLREWFPHDWDLKADFRQAHAFFLARFLGDVEKARPIWSDILASGFGKNAQKYIEAANFERQFGNPEQVRKYLNTALNSVSDDINSIYQYYIQFEREEGSLEQLDQVLEKINSQVAHRAKRPQKTVVEPKIPPKIAQKRPFKPEKVEKPVEKKPAENAHFQAETSSDEEKNRTIFVSNLDFGTTEEDLHKILKGIVKIRFAKRVKGDLHRGFGYIVMENGEFVREALKKDRILVNGRPMFVSKNDPENRVGFKYSKGLEKAKLFVRNVHFKADEKELEKIFSEFGKVANVRIVRHKNGQPKGCAYIDYETEEAATKALMATKIELRNRELSVALSNPPTKSADKKIDSSKPSTSANSASSSNSAQFLAPDQSATRKSMLQFLPRSTTKPAAHPVSAEKPAENQDLAEIPAKKQHKPMSNDQFRQFLMKKS